MLTILGVLSIVMWILILFGSAIYGVACLCDRFHKESHEKTQDLV